MGKFSEYLKNLDEDNIFERVNTAWPLLPKKMRQRAVEAGMRISKNASPEANLGNVMVHATPEQIQRVASYVVTGKSKDKNSRTIPLRPSTNAYTGMWIEGKDKETFDPNQYSADLIDAVVYNKPVDETIGRQLTQEERKDLPFKSVTQYIQTEPQQSETYTPTSQEGITSIKMNNGQKYSGGHGEFMTRSGYPIDNAGISLEYGTRNDSVFVRGHDTWDFGQSYSKDYKGDRRQNNNLIQKVNDELTGSVGMVTPWVYAGDAKSIGISQNYGDYLSQYANSNTEHYQDYLDFIQSGGTNTPIKQSTVNSFREAYPYVNVQDEEVKRAERKYVHKQGGSFNYLNYIQ